MKRVTVYFLLFPAFLFLASSGATAQMGYYNAEQAEEKADESAEAQVPGEEPTPGMKSFTVTSPHKCFSQLSREDALDIQRNFVKPYQECQRRLAAGLKKKQEEKQVEKEKQAETKEVIPERTPRGFYRVQKGEDDKKSPKKPDSEEKTTAKKLF